MLSFGKVILFSIRGRVLLCVLCCIICIAVSHLYVLCPYLRDYICIYTRTE